MPQDGYANFNVGQIQHSPFSALSNYGAEIGSGVKDIYQNCYLPSEGPSGAQGKCSVGKNDCSVDSDCLQAGERCEGVISASCGVVAGKPYCCDGVAKTQAEWEDSSCYTGY